MTPTIGLGLWDAPSIEFAPEDINPIMIAICESCDLSDSEVNDIATFFGLDTIFLERETIGLFRKLEKTCRGIEEGSITEYSMDRMRTYPQLAHALHDHPQDGAISAGTRSAARRYLGFLSENPQYWPPETRTVEWDEFEE